MRYSPWCAPDALTTYFNVGTRAGEDLASSSNENWVMVDSRGKVWGITGYGGMKKSSIPTQLSTARATESICEAITYIEKVLREERPPACCYTQLHVTAISWPFGQHLNVAAFRRYPGSNKGHCPGKSNSRISFRPRYKRDPYRGRRFLPSPPSPPSLS